MFSSAKIYARQFKPIEGGYLYYPTRWSQGYLVTEPEFEELCADWRKFESWKSRLKLFAWILGAALLMEIVALTLNLPATFTTLATFLFAVAYVVYFQWRFWAPHRLIRLREPHAPRRSSREADLEAAARLTWPLTVLVVALSLWLVIVMAAVTFANPWIGAPLLAIFGFSAFLNFRIAFRKWASRMAR